VIFRLCSMINKCVSQLVGLPEWQLRREHKVDAAKSWMVHMHGDVFVPLIFERLYGVYKPFDEHRPVKDGGLTTCLKGTA
jgi:hypothetical protein